MASRFIRIGAVAVVGLFACASSGAHTPARTHRAEPISAAAKKHPASPRKVQAMNVVYVRSGGFAGMMDRVEIQDGHLKVERRKRVLVDRPLTDAERTKLASLVKAAEATTPNLPAENPRLNDGFNFTLSIAGAPTPELRVYGTGLPHGLGEAWDALFAEMHALFEQAVKQPH